MKSLLFLAMMPLLNPQSLLPGCQAKLETQWQGDLLTIRGHCLNPSKLTSSLRYELFTDKRGESGTSRNTQGGEVILAGQLDRVLSQTTINVAPADYYRVRLRLFNQQGDIVAADSLIHPGTSRP